MDIPAISPTPMATIAVDRVTAPSPPARQTGNAAPQGQRTDTEPTPARPDVERATTLVSSSQPTRALGPVRFEQEDGTRIAKFFNPKDVLIYQVPPEGRLFLIKTGEASSQDQIQTSA